MGNSTTTKAKSFLLGIIVACAFVLKVPELIKGSFGDHTGVIIIAFVGLAFSLLVCYWKIRYNTSTGDHGWTKYQIDFAALSGVLLAFGIIKDWATANNVVLSGGFLDIMARFTVFVNTALAAITTDWSAFKTSMLDQLGGSPITLPENLQKKEGE